MITLKSLSALELSGGAGVCYGGSQAWYSSYWRRLAGCGPTNAANLIWHLAATRPAMNALWELTPPTPENFARLMEAMFSYVTPGLQGVNKTAVFREGALKFAQGRGVRLGAQVLDIPRPAQQRPGIGQVEKFILHALKNDLPVAFLNLSNGQVKNLDNWHWVTLVGYEPGGAMMYDQGKAAVIDLRLWLESTANGGGFVALEPAEGEKQAKASVPQPK